ncbi:MAG: hypothetical protein IPJ94_19750 [Chloroflexi bacterium]|jgi:hypothetical protein|nr:hypothetical protein [Chloroflexota bacterium]
MAPLTPLSYHEVIEACAETGCPICRIGTRSAERYLAGLIYDSVNDVPTRAKLRESLGFCHEHTWRAPEAGESAPLGLAFIYRDVVNTLNKRLKQLEFQSQGPAFWRQIKGTVGVEGKNASVGKLLVPTAVCPACERRSQMEGLAITAVNDALAQNDAKMLATLEQSSGFCLPHLRQALDNAGSQAAFDHLIRMTSATMDTLIGQLDEFIRKNDHRFQDESFNEEADSWLRAIRLVSGNEGL